MANAPAAILALVIDRLSQRRHESHAALRPAYLTHGAARDYAGVTNFAERGITPGRVPKSRLQVTGIVADPAIEAVFESVVAVVSPFVELVERGERAPVSLDDDAGFDRAANLAKRLHEPPP